MFILPQKKYTERKKEQRESGNKETFGVVLIIISTFLELCLLTRGLFLGDFGKAISNVLLGTVGYFAYALMLAFIICGIFIVQRRELSVKPKYVVFTCVIIFAMLCIAQLAVTQKYISGTFGSYVSNVYSAKNTVGGVLVSLVNYPVYLLFRKVFSYIFYALIILISFVFMSGIIGNVKRGNKPVVKRRTAAKAPTKQTERVRVSDPFAPRNGNGLFIGSIERYGEKYSDAQSFDDAPSSRDNYYDDDPMPPAPAPTAPVSSTPQYYENDSRSYFSAPQYNFSPAVPIKAQSEPAVKSETSILSRISVPSPKSYSDIEFVPGEIINGESIKTVTDAASETHESDNFAPYPGENEEEAAKTEQKKDTSAANYPKPNVQEYNYSPIVNGEKFRIGGGVPIVDMSLFAKKYATEKDDPGKVDEQASLGAFISSGNVTESFDEDIIKPEEPETEFAVERTDVYAENEEKEESPIIFGDRLPKFEYVPIPQTPIINGDNVTAEDDIFDTFSLDEQDEAVGQLDSEYEQIDISVGDYEDDDEDDYDDRSYESEPNVLTSVIMPEPEPEISAEKERSESFEKTTTSFKIIDEVEDLSERSYSNPNDTTGYYKVTPAPTAPVPMPTFAQKASDIDRKIKGNVVAGQIDVDSYMQDQSKGELEKMRQVQAEKVKKARPKRYTPPPIDLLTVESTPPEIDEDDEQQKINDLQDLLEDFGFPAKVVGVTHGPTVSRYELQNPPKTRINTVCNFANDIKGVMHSMFDIRIQAPIPGENTIGIEVPNRKQSIVALKDIIASDEFKLNSSPLTIALGKDINGKIITTSLADMPHLLIAGSTGSGKSACLNCLLVSLIYKASPEDVRLILVDPKQVEFTPYRGLPHLLIPAAITDVNQALNAFKWACAEMDRRYAVFSSCGVRNIKEYNKSDDVVEGVLPKMPYLVVIVDEFADLITSSQSNRKTLEEYIQRLASLARAAGLHLVLATQRPSADVITGTINSNLPSRIAFAVANNLNSRIILDESGAEMLLGKGDMIFKPQDIKKQARVQGAYVETGEINNIVAFAKQHYPAEFDGDFEKAITAKARENGGMGGGMDSDMDSEFDSQLAEIVRMVIKAGSATSSSIQRRFRFGFNKARRALDRMEDLGFIGPANGAQPREVLITKEKFEEFFGEDFE